MDRIPGHEGCQCAACGEVFSNHGTFTLHRTGSFKADTRRCMTPAEMRKAGLTVGKRGYWVLASREGGSK